MKARDPIRVIQRNGWYLVRTRGSHRQYKHPFKPGRVTIPGKLNDDLAFRNAQEYFEAGRYNEVKKYLIILEKTTTGYSAYSPDLPGCASTGQTREEVEANMHEAVQFHIDGLKEEGCEIPEPSAHPEASTDSSYVHVAA